MPEWIRATIEILTLGISFLSFCVLLTIWEYLRRKGGD